MYSVDTHLALKAIVKTDNRHALMQKVVMIENSVASCPPCWLAVDVKAAPTFPINFPVNHSPPVVSQKLAI
jgi:hypothetical protein